MSEPNVHLIKKLYELGRFNDLYLLITGESPYSLQGRSGDNYPERSSISELAREENYTCRMAEEHLWFVLNFGATTTKAEREGKYYSAYPEYFERWLNAGCKRVHQEELEEYLKYHPI